VGVDGAVQLEVPRHPRGRVDDRDAAAGAAVRVADGVRYVVGEAAADVALDEAAGAGEGREARARWCPGIGAAWRGAALHQPA